MRDKEDVFLQDTLIIMVIYNCVITQSSAFQSLVKSNPSKYPKNIFLYDNSLSAQELPSGNNNIYYYHNPLNAGVSAAYNEGFRKAKQLDLKWLLLLDQDTELSEDALKKYEHHVSIYRDKDVFAPMIMGEDQIISPFKLRWGKGIKIKHRQPGVHSFRHLCVINSGLLISCELFERAGGYDERFPLDFSDIVFMERLSAIIPGFVWIDAVCVHSLSSQQDKNTNTATVLNRFKKYCAAAALFKKESDRNILLSFILLPRSIKLSLMKKDFRFLTAALKTWIASR